MEEDFDNDGQEVVPERIKWRGDRPQLMPSAKEADKISKAAAREERESLVPVIVAMRAAGEDWRGIQKRLHLNRAQLTKIRSSEYFLRATIESAHASAGKAREILAKGSPESAVTLVQKAVGGNIAAADMVLKKTVGDRLELGEQSPEQAWAVIMESMGIAPERQAEVMDGLRKLVLSAIGGTGANAGEGVEPDGGVGGRVGGSGIGALAAPAGVSGGGGTGCGVGGGIRGGEDDHAGGLRDGGCDSVSGQPDTGGPVYRSRVAGNDLGDLSPTGDRGTGDGAETVAEELVSE